MAYLNVRERRIETKIAYVGPAFSGKATNLDRLKSDGARGRSSALHTLEGGAGDLVALDWVPLNMPRFNDCDVAVKVVAAKGEISTERLDDLLADVDGVVVVVDAAPDAQEDNRRAVSLVRDALAKDSVTHRPVVVQLNKSDLLDALPADELSSLLSTGAWPVVAASAERGEGVVETLEMALTHVIEGLRARDEPQTAVKADHHPLLDALRRLLRETVTEHMADIEREVLSRVVSSAASAVADRTSKADDALRTRLDTLARAVSRLQESVDATRVASERAERETARSLTAQEQGASALAAVVELSVADMSQLAAMMNEAAATLNETAARTRELHATSAELCNRVEVAAVETRIREQIVSTASVVRRAVEGIALDVKRGAEVRERVTALGAELEKLHTKSDATLAAIAPIATATAQVPTRIAAAEAALQRDLREGFGPRLARIDDSVQVMHVEAGESLARAEARIVEIQTGLTELLDELKKRKKGWFS